VRFIHGNGYDYCLADAVQAYGGKLTRFDRHVFHLRPGLFLLMDRLSAPAASTFEWWLHAYNEMQLQEEERSVLVQRDHARLLVRFLEGPSLEFYQDNQFTPEPERGSWKPHWHFKATTEPVSHCNLLALLSPYKEGETAASGAFIRGEGCFGASIPREDGGWDRILFKETDQKRFSHERIESDGEAVAIGVDASENVDRWLIVEGSRLDFGERKLHASKKRTTTCLSLP